ncbi:adenylate kinase [candidate division MSBL1 archaeon SCGC-AAA259O05]|uniref:Adenylate kinase n=1 Tax=candidate division MSBL1 archaeon SCGC-AAA259O05 TaxID=1698271 RepID=A0A133V444_9EURY|nr:adenylate kinase [candidate division MSBL1 archaeon SCGC-AAA259O05]
MNLIILGPPGGGKGTYASRISEEYGIPHIATGDILRREVNEKSELGKKVEDYLDRGALVPDEIVNEIVKKRISEPDCQEGFVLDGYPRTLAQAKALDEVTEIDLVINLEVSEEVIIDRLTNRRVCRDCGEIYNLKSMPPEKEGVCDKCGGELYQREDDRPEVIKKRLREYVERTQPVIDFYRGKELVEDIVAEEERPIDEMMGEIYEAMEKGLTA